MNIDSLVNDNAKLIYKIASKFYGVDMEDLYQAGIVGLLKAIKNYQSNNGAKFSTFAYKYIFGEMFLLSNNKKIKINRDILKMAKLIEKTRYEYAQKLNHIPSNKEISDILKINMDTVNFVCASSNQILSIDNDSEEERSMYEMIAYQENISNDDKILLYESLNKLPKAEQKVIFERYFKDETQDKIALKMNTSQVRISRLEKKGLVKMKELMQVH